MIDKSAEKINNHFDQCKTRGKKLEEDVLSDDIAIEELLKLHLDLNREINRIKKIIFEAGKIEKLK